ncbi:PREDICTED: glycosylphosphatidylinositol-anchored high density lipoprotein-binding protein 1 [Chinchilla lanigera]|uniref:Glycosylphosphatidylinositol anchored high density lipoprotein binding protein 1 n=1 Tax=Chinchilla lanigera TaxID=34839 RepID=A0A8C2VHD8_CHILA|nr:PREDICTED: glycosylphosphatidylinositol-anchored high density lipoprotein-binding protein 1 [Chinchilla lanigera]XP_005395817.1 PREDICTED: glycosylphosphatidylinositol-anchored high density lipoprotein-binding protein 1 [Chinchilla lanigera]XP_013375462.1 PREDICTED: glycosylphosphatidylinositol-anchored high density lipoprotein-binding protein 1 [Chinchilla lanigera]
MKALGAVVLALLLCGQPGSSQAQEEEEDDRSPDSYGYDDDDEEEETHSRDRALPCYHCPLLHHGDRCDQIQNCSSSQDSCVMLVSHSNTDSGSLTTYSMWCTDSCQPVIKTVEGTQMTETCCQSPMCNVPPWQHPQVEDLLNGKTGSPQDDRASHPQAGGSHAPPSCPQNVGTALLFSLFTSLWVVGT